MGIWQDVWWVFDNATTIWISLKFFKCDGLAVVLASAAVTVAVIAIANLTFALFDGARWGIIRCFNVGAPGAIERMQY